jgi:flagellar biosynthesis anti-sigma factor FlgM
MAIEGISSLGGINQPDDRKVDSDKRVDREKQAEKSAGSNDTVELSSGEAARLNSLFDSIPDVRSDKVEALRSQIENGSYNVEPDALVDSILEELF